MIAQISLLTATLFAALYPLCFLISYNEPLQNKFHKFHLGLPNFVGGVVLVFVVLADFSLSIKMSVLVWKLVCFGLSNYFWKKDCPNPFVMTIPVVLGLAAFFQLMGHWFELSVPAAFAFLIGGLIFTSIIYAMNLGHWYLNVHGLPFWHLRRAVYLVWVFAAARFLWDAIYLPMGRVMAEGYSITYWQFIQTMNGFLLLLAIFFGALFPLVTLYFVKGTLDVKNTQSATGILYVILSAVLIGDITYKYYFIKFGVIL